ncbi:unnamed protein product, partial [Chrysoparadoxa australica]
QVIAVTVDGTVQSMDAWTGEVYGDFDSGGPVVSSSTRMGHRMDQDLVIPGLDGVIYTLSRDGELSVLPSSAPDLVLEPKLTRCFSAAAEDVDDDCGLLIGEKTTKLFAIDTSSGLGHFLGGGAGSSTTAKTATLSAGADTLLLQRDEYVVRALSTDSNAPVGIGELWNVTVAHFTALDASGPLRAGLTRSKAQASALDGSVGEASSDGAELFPLMFYDDQMWIVAVNPADGDELWRKQTSSLATSLYGISH